MNPLSGSPDRFEGETSREEGISLKDIVTASAEVRELLSRFTNGNPSQAENISVFENPEIMDPLVAVRLQSEMSLLRQAMGTHPLPPDYQQKLHEAMKTLDFSGMVENRPPKKKRKGDFQYNARVGDKWRYNPESKEPQWMSRSRIDLFFDCQRCFYFRQKEGLKMAEGFSPNLNIALDLLLKREFDFFRKHALPHPIMLRNGLNGVPLQHENMTTWRDALSGGLRVVHQPTNLLVTAAPDDIWIIDGKASIVDYKSTFTEHIVTLEDQWKKVYKRQVELNAWLLSQDPDIAKLGYGFSEEAYFVYSNARVKHPLFSNNLPFETELIRRTLDFSWIEPALKKIKEVLDADKPPATNGCCDECLRRDGYREVLLEQAVEDALRKAQIEGISEGVRKGLAGRLKRHLGRVSERFLALEIEKLRTQKPGQQLLFPDSPPSGDT